MSQNLSSVTDLIHHWLTQQAPQGLDWIEQKRTQIAQGAPARVFFTAFSAVPRYTGKQDLRLTQQDWQTIETICPGWFPGHWSIDQAARTLLVLSLPANDAEKYLQTLEQVFTAADMGELVALYQTLPLLPFPDSLRLRAAEGLRSNITAVFNVIALRNPYPAQYFDTVAWNQMVLKALFVGSPLHLIQGIDQRANPELAQMLIDYAHERWAAKRPVSPELWRPVGQSGVAVIPELERVFAEPDPLQQAAAAIACSQSPLPEAKALLNRYPDLKAAISSGQLTWDSISP